jgi:hypothetical protein
MNVRRGAVCFAALMLLTACPKKDESDEDEKPRKTSKSASADTATAAPTAAPTPTTAPTPTPVTTEAAIPTPAGGGIKAELDNRSDGINGTALSVPGARASTQAPTGWTPSKDGDAQVFTSGDQKARIAASSFGADGHDKKLESTAKAAGLSGCTFGAAEPVANVGKDKLGGVAAEGTCQRGAGSVKAAYLATEGLLVLGSFDTGGDSPNVYGSMRSVAKAAAGGGGGGIAACCAALRQNAASAPPQQIGMYLAAAGACDAAKSNPQAAQALASIRGMLAGANVPGVCR